MDMPQAIKTKVLYRDKLLLGLCFCISFLFNLKYIERYSFLQDWDERFHALVAKNLVENSFLPLLYKDSPIPVCDYTSWVCNTVWLHKQPLFLWQLALSIKLFGANEWAVRFPSALMLSLIVFPVFRIGMLMFNKQTGYVAALLTVSNWFILEHIDGQMGMDHNDIAFMFYVTLSIWALMEYIRKPKLMFLLLMGLFSGCAMLNKWVTGLLVFDGFLVYCIMQGVKNSTQNCLRLTISVMVAFLIFIPWQVYCFTHFHDNMVYEWAYNRLHFWEVLEGHWHERYYYFYELNRQFSLLPEFIFIGLFFSFFKADKRKFIFPVQVMAVSIYVFFTVASTKISSYVMVTMPLLFVFMAYAFTAMLDFIRTMQHNTGVLLYAVCIPFVIFQNVNYKKTDADYGPSYKIWHQRCLSKQQNAIAYRGIAKMGLGEKVVIVGLEKFDPIDAMFYTGYPSYGYYISKTDINTIRSKGYKIVVFKNSIPPSVQGDRSLIVVPYNYL